MLSIVPLNNIPFWGTIPISCLNVSKLKSLTSTPLTSILPSVTSKNLSISLTIVLLPLPVEPIIAKVEPFGTLKLRFSSTYSSPSGYLNETFLNSSSPILSLSNGKFLLSLMLFSLFNTSLIRLIEIIARGAIIDNMLNIKKDIITCIV